MLVGISKKEVKEYIVAADKDSAKPTVFLIGNISNEDKINMIGSVIGPDGVINIQELQAKTVDIVKAGLKGIHNFFDPDQKQSVDVKEITPEVVDAIPFAFLYELAGQIIKANFELGEIRKNS